MNTQPTNLEQEQQKALERVGYDAGEKERAGSFIQQDDSLIAHRAIEKNVDIMGIEDALEKYPAARAYYGKAFAAAIDRFAEHYADRGIQHVVAAEARGFIFAAPLALRLQAGFIPIRKPGKLPFDTHAFHYELEYGTDTLEMHIDSVQPGQRVLVVDDLLATGGTVDACCQLLEKTGAVVEGCAFVIHLTDLGGARRIGHHEVFSLVEY